MTRAAEQPRHLHAVNADTAARPDQQDGVVRVDPRPLAHAMPVRVDGIGRDRGRLVAQAVRNRQEVRGRQADIFGEPAVAVGADIAAEILAQRLAPAAAPTAAPAGEIEIDRAPVADRKPGHALADLDDLPREFMTHDTRYRAAEPAEAHVDQRQPHPGGAHAHHRLADAGAGIGAFFQPIGFLPVVQDHGLHCRSFLSRRGSGPPPPPPPRRTSYIAEPRTG